MSQSNIYSNPELYDAIHNGLDLDAKFIKKAASEINGSVLELACGTGRLAGCILDLGLNLISSFEGSIPLFLIIFNLAFLLHTQSGNEGGQTHEIALSLKKCLTMESSIE